MDVFNMYFYHVSKALVEQLYWSEMYQKCIFHQTEFYVIPSKLRSYKSEIHIYML